MGRGASGASYEIVQRGCQQSGAASVYGGGELSVQPETVAVAEIDPPLTPTVQSLRGV